MCIMTEQCRAAVCYSGPFSSVVHSVLEFRSDKGEIPIWDSPVAVTDQWHLLREMLSGVMEVEEVILNLLRLTCEISLICNLWPLTIMNWPVQKNPCFQHDNYTFALMWKDFSFHLAPAFQYTAFFPRQVKFNPFWRFFISLALLKSFKDV